jgi:hypothetical protein
MVCQIQMALALKSLRCQKNLRSVEISGASCGGHPYPARVSARAIEKIARRHIWFCEARHGSSVMT